MSVLLEGQTYDYAACRSLGHAWDQIPSTRRPSWGTLMTLRCLRCSCVREDTLDSNYRLSTRRYIHPDNYKTDKRDRYEWVAAYAGEKAHQQLLWDAEADEKPKAPRGRGGLTIAS